MMTRQMFGIPTMAFEENPAEGKKTGDTKIISVCRGSRANDGGAGGGKSNSKDKKSHDFRGYAAGKQVQRQTKCAG